MKKFVILVCAVALVFGAGTAQAFLIDFNDDAAGAKANGWTSNDSPLVHFTDSQGSNLQVHDFGAQSDGRGLGVFGDDSSWLIMTFDMLMDAISLDFGNDDGCCSNPGDQAVLTLYLGAAQVGQTAVVMNRNDIMDQTIGYAGALFDRATLFYDVTTNGLIEVVDNIELNAVPEPSTVLLLGAGVLGLIGFGRKKFKK